jgi:hypothetical protein
MAANRHSKLIRLNARLERLRSERPVVFNLIALDTAVLSVALLRLIEWILR